MNQRQWLSGTVLVFSSVLLLSFGCGKKGPLIYPDMLTAQPPKNLLLEQSGSALRISFDLPDKDLSGRKLDDLEAFLIARRVYRGSDSISCHDTFVDLHKIDLAQPSPALRQGSRISWIDTDTHCGERYQYQLKTVQKGGVNGQAVSTVLAAVLTPPAPPLLKVHSAFGGYIQIELSGTVEPETTLLGYSLYRSQGGAKLQFVAFVSNGISRYDDQAVEQGVEYHYVARMTVKRADGVVAESDASKPVLVSVADPPQ